MARKNNTTSIRQRKAERRQRKVNRLAANGRKARAAKRELEARSAIVDYRADDISFDPSTEQVFTVSALIGDELRTTFGVVEKTTSDQSLLDRARGLVMAYTDTEGAVLLRFPSSWTTEKVMSKLTTDQAGFFMLVSIQEKPGCVRFGHGDEVVGFLEDATSEFCSWIADCGDSPDKNGNVLVKLDGSSALSRVRYNTHDKTLTVAFRKSDDVYIYRGVPRRRFVSLVNAESAGRYFSNNIREEYSYTRL